MRVVIDTSVLIAAVRSSLGASNFLLRMALQEDFKLLLSVPLFLEYEAVLTRPEHLIAAGLSPGDANLLLDTILDVAIPVHLGFFWPIPAQDEDDTHVLNLAVVGKADALVTHNVKHFAAEAAQLGIHLETPESALRRIRN